MLKLKIKSSKPNFLVIQPKTEIHAMNWLMGFFIFATAVVLLGERLPSAVRQYSFQGFLAVAILGLFFTGWRPLLGINRRTIGFILILFTAYFLGLSGLNFLAGQFGYEFPQQGVPRRDDLILLAVLAPFFEEIFFRDLIFRSLLHRLQKLWLAVFLSSVLFMVAHLTLYPGAFLLGFVNVCFLLYCQNLWAAILFHSISNLSLIFFPVWFPNLLYFLQSTGLFQQFYR